MICESFEESVLSYIPNSILTAFQNDYPYIQELIKYKRDGTLLYLKSQGAIAFYDGNFDLDVKSDVKDWQEFIEFSRNYTSKFVQDGLQKCKNDEKDADDNKKKFKILDMGILGPAIETISNTINREYLDKFPKWPTNGTQEGSIELNVKCFHETHKLRIYWLSRGTIFVKNTRYSSPRNGCNYRAEFSGKPEFQLSYFDLNKIRQCNEMAQKNMKQIKVIIDKLEEKYLEQSLSKLIINFDL
jgi:hypothetical protein